MPESTPERMESLICTLPRGETNILRALTDGCERQSFYPVIPDQDQKTALAAVKRAAVFVVVLAGAPTDAELNLAEAMVNRALEKAIPCIAFVAATTATDGGGRLETFRSRLQTELNAQPYSTLPELRGKLVNALGELHESNINEFHYVSEIPEPPDEYTAHPYTLLPTGQMVGRKAQLNMLSEWITATDHNVRALNVVAIGGMGKSAMTWKWYKDIAPGLMKPMAGRMWWSFYESDAYWENFVIRTLAYVTKSDEGEIREITPAERERELLEVLDREPYLIVMDGIERIMIAYARLDAVRIDDEALDEQTQNVVAGAIGLPANAKQSMFSPNRLRKTADPRAGAFLRKLATIRASRILISSRLYPADLQRPSGHPIKGSHALFLTGLDNDDAIALWRSFGCTGDADELLRIFNTFDNYPLVIRALAGEVSRYEAAPGNFEAWRKFHKDFDPLNEAPEQVKSHIMGYALHGLTTAERKTLDTIAAFRMPTYFDNLSTLLVKGNETETPKSEPTKGGGLGKLMRRGAREKPKHVAAAETYFEDAAGLDAALSELEGRGLIGWDRRGNRYDLHPIVRGVAWNALDEKARQGLYAKLNAHFGSLPPISIEDVHSLEDLTGAIEMYNTLIGLKQYDEAFVLYSERLHVPMLRRLNASLQRIELLEMLFPDGLEVLPKLTRQANSARAMNALALAYHSSGQPGRASEMYFRATKIAEQENNFKNVSIGLGNLSDTLRVSGNLRVAEMVANRALMINRSQDDRAGEAVSLQFVGRARLAFNDTHGADEAFSRALRILIAQGNKQLEGVCRAQLAELALVTGDGARAQRYADEAWDLAAHSGFEADYVRAMVAQGGAALALNDLARAEELLYAALTRARAVNLVEYELTAQIRLADVLRRKGPENVKAVRDLLEDVWESAERGPYRLLHAEGYMVLAALEDELNQPDELRAVAQALYYLAWCDGEPYAHMRALKAARGYYQKLAEPEPADLPPFDESQFGVYLPVEINPQDEFAG